jgi:POLO box duplicated region
MHDVLIKSFVPHAHETAGLFFRRVSLSRDHISSMAAKVWVLRYVDYTSKYGLGFLLNTGSTGVYFNDSTKIVQSLDGVMFQYVERKRRSGSDNVCQTHLMSSYPKELQKKVTLLRHFRNYLMDPEQKKKQNGCVENDFGQQDNIDPALPPPNFDAAVSSQIQGQGTEIPYLKKWVRTRHAILFRLSDQTVQVVFFDQRLQHIQLFNYRIACFGRTPLNCFSLLTVVARFCCLQKRGW